MANFMLTTACNFKCPYCFALDLVGKGHGRTDMTAELFEELVDWVGRADPPSRIHLMGGEPTVNERMPSMLRLLADRGMECHVFSNAARPLGEELLEAARAAGAWWIVNINVEGFYRGRQLERLHENLSRLGGSASLTFNLTPETEGYDFVPGLVDRFGLKRVVKLGFTLPTLSHVNRHVLLDEYRVVGAKAVALVRAFADRDIHVDFECGAPHCMFGAEELEEIRGHVGFGTLGRCHSRLDVSPEGKVFYCLPLYRHGAIDFREFEDYGAAVRWFHSQLLPFQAFGVRAECRSCGHHADGSCSGGCLAESLLGIKGVKPLTGPDSGAS